MRVEININMDALCAECGKKGAAQNGICLKCMTKVFQGKPMKSEQGRRVQERVRGAAASAKLEKPALHGEEAR